MTSTILFFQAAQEAAAFSWTPIIVAILASGSMSSLLTYLLSRRKYNADVHQTEAGATQTEVETVRDIIEDLPKFYRQLKDAHIKSLGDETTIAELKNKLRACLETNTKAGCSELKAEIYDLLMKAESRIEKFDDVADLLGEVRRMKVKLMG